MQKKSIVFLLVLCVSILPEILVLQFAPSWLPWILPVKSILVFLLLILSYKKYQSVFNFGLVCFVILIFQFLSDQIQTIPLWKETFPANHFVGFLAGSMILKSLSAVMVLLVLFIRLKDRRSFFFVKGNLDVYASEIKWLGIPKNWVKWKKLALISGILISLGTFLGTIFTVTGFNFPDNYSSVFKMLPYILMFAFLNSLFEGIVFRNGILGTLSKILPKDKAILISALIFGIAHYFGAPGGFVGAIMASFLGWFLGRSVLDTQGMAAAWLIHFMQDTVVFIAFYLFAFL